MENVVKIILAILLFICLAYLPYPYYQIVRFVALVGFATLAYNANEKVNKTEMIVYLCLTILFQPLIKISLGRDIWNVVDVVVGICLLISIFIKPKAIHEK